MRLLKSTKKKKTKTTSPTSTISRESATFSCPVCLENQSNDISIANRKYPILCRTKECDFNVCSPCLTTMLSNFYEDGGGLQLRQVPSLSDNQANGSGIEVSKLNLDCPKCEKPFCVSVEDVLMLRRSVAWRRTLRDMNDGELSATELREKYYWSDERLSEAKLVETRYENVSAGL